MERLTHFLGKHFPNRSPRRNVVPKKIVDQRQGKNEPNGSIPNPMPKDGFDGIYYSATPEDTHTSPRNAANVNKNFPRQPEVPGSLLGIDDVKRQPLQWDDKSQFKKRTDSGFDKDLGDKGMNVQENA